MPAVTGSGNIVTVIIIAVVSTTILILLGCILLAVISGVICRKRYASDSFGAGYHAVLCSRIQCIVYIRIHDNNIADITNIKARSSMTA